MFVIVDANNWFRRYMYSDRFLSVDGMIAELASLDPTFIVWDGFNGNARRREIYPDYKKERKERDKDTDFETLNLIRKELIEFLPGTSVYADGYEGDDVINYLCSVLEKTGETITILSTDKDLAAISPTSDKILNPLVSEKFFKVVGERRWIPLYKTLVGDKSDSIPGLKGFGDKSWESLSPWNRDKLCEVFSLGLSEILNKGEDKIFMKIRENFSELKKMWDIVSFLPVEKTSLTYVDSKYDLCKINQILRDKGVLFQ